MVVPHEPNRAARISTMFCGGTLWRDCDCIQKHVILYNNEGELLQTVHSARQGISGSILVQEG